MCVGTHKHTVADNSSYKTTKYILLSINYSIAIKTHYPKATDTQKQTESENTSKHTHNFYERVFLVTINTVEQFADY